MGTSRQQAIQRVKYHFIDSILPKLTSLNYNYVFRKYTTIECPSFFFDIQGYIWNDNGRQTDALNSIFEFKFSEGIQIKGSLLIRDNLSNDIFHNDITLNLIVIALIFLKDENECVFSCDILDKEKEIILQYTELIEKIQDDQKLVSLTADDVLFNGKSPMEFFTGIIDKKNQIYPFKNSMELFDDIAFTFEDIRYELANLVLYKPYTKNYMAYPLDFNGQTIYTHFPTYIDKNYFRRCNILFQVIYNYWDRIGDTLSFYFPHKMKPNSIYFGKVIESIPAKYRRSSNYGWLNDFKNNQYNKLNEDRKKIVHYESLETAFYRDYTTNITNVPELMVTQLQKEFFGKYFHKHLNNAFIGFEKSMLLIDEFS